MFAKNERKLAKLSNSERYTESFKKLKLIVIELLINWLFALDITIMYIDLL